ncbi:hypothetical protein V2O64_17335 [Verrucomicrobiaceae bacterium 227]
MKMMAYLAATLSLITGAAHAGELEDQIAVLRTNYESLEGYWAKYEARTETGKNATFEQGADFASGWAFVRLELRDPLGKVVESNEQWSTGEGDYIMRRNGDVLVFTGLGSLGDRFNKLRQLFKKDEKIAPMNMAPNCHLTKTGVNSAIGFSTKGLEWFSNVVGLLDTDEKTTTLNWGEHGTIVLDQTSGLLLSQTIQLEDGAREMKQVDWKKNPGAKMISSRMTINLDGANKKELAGQGMGRKMLGTLLQELINGTDKNPALGNDLQEFMDERQDAINDYLSEEVLEGVPFPKKEALFNLIENFSVKALEKLEQDGKAIPEEQLFQHAGFQKTLVTILAEGLRKQAKGINREKHVEDALAGPLVAESETAKAAKTLIEDSIEKAYFHHKLSKALEAYKLNRWGR